MTDMYDVLLEVTTYGICSPHNSHSYRGSFILLPCVCSSCKQTIYPLITAAVTCIRCQSVAHRGACMRSAKFHCPKIKQKIVKRESRNVEIVHKECSSECSDHDVSIIERKDEGESIAAVMEPISVPSPGTSDCMWSKNLQLLADKQSVVAKYTDISSLSRSNSFGVDFFLALDFLVKSVLEDANTFPGEVCSTLHSLFLTTHFGSDRNTLAHARRCLDTVSCAVLSILPDDITDGNYTVTEAVSNIVDRHVLGLSHRAMYFKVFLAAQLISDSDDRRISSLCCQRANKDNNGEQANSDNSDGQDEDKYRRQCKGGTKLCALCESVKSTLMRVTTLISPRDKLSQLRKALQIISAYQSSHSCAMEDAQSSDPKELLHPLSPTLKDKNDKKDINEKDGNDENDGDGLIARTSLPRDAINADTLLEVVSNIILASFVPHAGLEGLEANGEELSVFWFAECAYVESMMREGDWSLGIDSYALTTVMQALQSIIH